MLHIALSGGCIISRRFSVCQDERFLALVRVLRGADVAFSHLEGTISEGDMPEVYPAAEAGWTWRSNPLYFAEELKWAGFDIVSHASNHCLDYMYGGLYATWNALKKADIPYAGTGMSLNEARKPAYLDTAKGRVALISASSSTADWARASNATRDDRGRPGANQLRMQYRVDAETAKTVKALAAQMGCWMTEVDDEFMISPAGLHNTVTRYIRSNDAPGVTVAADRSDVEANLRSIREARLRADFVLMHIHNHEWNPQVNLATPPEFIRSFAKACIDAGADLFIAEGAHALLRGDRNIQGEADFYDPGDLFKDGNSKTRHLSEYYWMKGWNAQSGKWEITTAESEHHADKQRLPIASNPPGGYNTGKVHAVIVPVCSFGDDGQIKEIKLYPARHLTGSHALSGLPGLETGDRAREIIEYVAELSAPYGTQIHFKDGLGMIQL